MLSGKQIVFLMFISSVVSCVKDAPIPPEKSCNDLPASPPIGWNYQIDSPYFMFPYFNPINPDEILFQEKYSSKLFRYNLVTQQRSLIYSGTNLFQPKWGKNDWILLNPVGNIWKIKSDGDSLIILTNTHGDYAPEWNISGDKFCFYRSLGAFQKLIIADVNGTELETLNNFYTEQSSWQHSNLIITTSGMYGLHSIDPYTDLITVLLQQDEPTLESAVWLDNNVDILYTAENGIFKMNYQTKKITCILSSCSTRNYLFPTYSSISNKVIFQRLDQKAVNSSTVEISSRLFMMNPDGTGESEITIH